MVTVVFECKITTNQSAKSTIKRQQFYCADIRIRINDISFRFNPFNIFHILFELTPPLDLAYIDILF